MGYAPLMNGSLARQPGTVTERSKRAEGTRLQKKLRDCDLEIIKRVTELAQKHSWTMSQVALAWSLTKTTSPIVGANTVRLCFGPMFLMLIRVYSARTFARISHHR